MSETLKFGNGEWAVKEGSALAYNDENGNFKPLPFTFDRSTSATRVNKEGLIEVVSNNEPRIDFLNDSKGALLLEPSRSNLVQYSEAFDNAYWSKSGGTSVLANQYISPDGTLNAEKINFSSSNQTIARYFSLTSDIYTLSVYVKGNVGETIRLANLGTESNFTLTGEWQRIELTRPTATSAGNIVISTYGGATAREIFVWGAQLEQGSYATSYIPTQGSIGTRVEEDIALTLPDDASFNSSNGFSLYGEFLTNGGSGSSSMALQFNANSGYFGFGHNGSGWRARINDGTDNELHNSSASIFSVGKLALSFNSSGFNMYANGSSFASGNTDMSAITSADSIVFRDTDEFGSFRIRDLKLYNTRLTDQELINLTKI